MGAALPALGVPTGAAFYDAALEGHVRTNMLILQRDPTIPPIMTSGVQYSVNRSKQWKFADKIVDEGVGDCEGLSAWRVAELRVSGEDPDSRVRTYRTGPTKFHAVVERCDGIIEDPSAIFGMPIRNPASYIGKLVDNFGEGAVQGDDDGSSIDDFYNAPPPNEDGDDRGSEIDDFFHTDPQQVDMGPGVGPADPEYYGEAPPDSGGGGGGGGDSGGGGGGGGDQGQQQQRQRDQQGQQQRQRDQQGQQGQQGQQRPQGQQQRPQGQQQGQARQQGQQAGASFGRQSSSGRSTSSSSGRSTSSSSGRSSSSGSGMHAAPPPIKAPKPALAKKSAPKRGGRTHGVDGVIDVPFICLEGPGDDFDRGSFNPDEESGPDDAAGFRPYDPEDDTRDVSVDIQPTDDGGFVSTVRVPVAGGNTVVAQSSKADTAKKAATKAFNIAKILGNNKTVQDALPPTAKLTLAALKSPDAAKVFQQLKW